GRPREHVCPGSLRSALPPPTKSICRQVLARAHSPHAREGHDRLLGGQRGFSADREVGCARTVDSLSAIAHYYIIRLGGTGYANRPRSLYLYSSRDASC